MATDVTRGRLLDAAEALLRNSSYDELRIRAVCERAGVNPAAVHYHFGSREALVAALLQDRLGPIWAEPLDAVSRQPTTVRKLVETILAPLRPLAEDPATAPLLRLLGRFVLTHPDLAWTATWFRTDTWVTALRSVVDLDEATARRRWRFAFSVLMTELAAPTPASPASSAALGDFLTAGLSATERTSS